MISSDILNGIRMPNVIVFDGKVFVEVGEQDDYHSIILGIGSIKKVIFNRPSTIVLWSDGSKTVVKCMDGDFFSEEVGLAMCCAKKLFGNKGKFNDVFKKWIPRYVREEEQKEAE